MLLAAGDIEEGVDAVLTAHEHSYARHAPMDADGKPTAGGTRLFVVAPTRLTVGRAAPPE